MSFALEWIGCQRFSLYSSLTPEECVRRLRGNAEARPADPSLLRVSVRGMWFRRDIFRLHLRRPGVWKPSLSISGTICREGSGSRIDLLAFFPALACYAPVIAIIFYANLHGHEQLPTFALASVWSCFAVVSAMFVFYRPDVPAEHRIMLDYLHDTIGARKRRRQ